MRAELRIPRQRIAAWARVSEDRVAAFEVDPTAVGSERRARIERVYRVLSDALAQLRRLGIHLAR